MARSRAGNGRSSLPAATPSSSVFACSAVITSGSFFGAFGVRTRRATLSGTTPSRSMKRNSPRTAASLRRMVTAASSSDTARPATRAASADRSPPARAARGRAARDTSGTAAGRLRTREWCARNCPRARVPPGSGAIWRSQFRRGHGDRHPGTPRTLPAPAGRPRRGAPSCRGAVAGGRPRRAAAAGRSDVGGLVILRVGAGDVVAQRARARSRAARGAGSRRRPARRRASRPSARSRSIPRSLRRRRSGRRRRSRGASAVAASASSSAGALMYVLRWIWPKRRNSAFSRPGIRRSTRACSPNFMWFWKPTRLKLSARRFSWRSCTTAQGRRPVRGSASPIGFIGPKRSVSRPRRAISSIGRQASK